MQGQFAGGGSGGTGLSVAASEDSEITREINKLQGAVSKADENLTLLVSRLSPILKPQQPTPEPANKELEPALSPLGNAVRSARQSISKMDETITYLHKHLAI